MDGWMVLPKIVEVFVPNLASEWILQISSHVESKIWPNLAVAKMLLLSLFIYTLWALGGLCEEVGVGRLPNNNHKMLVLNY